MNYTANALGLLAGMGIPLEALGGQHEAPPIQKRKCMREGCENPRSGGRDYCSLECRRIHRGTTHDSATVQQQ